MKKLVLSALILVVILGMTGCRVKVEGMPEINIGGDFGSGVSYSEDGSGSLEAQGINVLDIEGINGKVTVTGDDTENIGMQYTKQIKRNLSEDKLKEILDKIDVVIQRQGDKALVTVNYHGESTDNINVKVNLKVPKGVEVKVGDTNGGVVVSGMENNVTVSDTNGGIEVNGITGDAAVTGVSGGIDISDVSGDLKINDVSGGLRVTRAMGGIDIGDVNGGIQLRLPGDIKATFDISGYSGSVSSIDFPLQGSKRHLYGDVNGGGNIIKIYDISGGLLIEKI